MKTYAIITSSLPVLVSILFAGCSKYEATYQPAGMSFDLPRLELQNGNYYRIGVDQRSVEIDFSEAVDSATIGGNITFAMAGQNNASGYTVTSFERKVFVLFAPEFSLMEGRQYCIRILPGFKSRTGKGFASEVTIELRSSTLHPLTVNSDTSRNSIICISDIHMNDARATTRGYAWFGQNSAALDSLLGNILISNRVKQVVILGDLFDEWVVPYRMIPFDPQAGILNTRDYFLTVASNPVNSGIVEKLKSIAGSGTISLIYVPGNHDMLLTKEIVQEIIPGIIWMGDATGVGHYSPEEGIITEHGHRYDFFNCPQPLTQPGHILPPGYFVTRLDAQGLMEKKGNNRQTLKDAHSSLAFLTAWTAAFTYLQVHYGLTVAPDSTNILMGGIDGYPGPEGFNAVRDRYAANIENVWSATAIANNVPVGMPATMAILDGNSDLYAASAYQFMQSQSPVKFRIVVFGHTHKAMIKVYPAGNQYTAIYGNTGTWVNDNLTTHPVRTFIEIRPGTLNGSTIDVVSLYQFNPAPVKGNGIVRYVPVLLSQESILR